MGSNIKCYLCGKSISLGKMEYSIVELEDEIESGQSYTTKDLEELAYICSECHNKIHNIKEGYLRI